MRKGRRGGATRHPWYDNWFYQRKNKHYPWKEDFHAFRRWAEKNKYNPSGGDRIAQRLEGDTYRVGIMRHGILAPGFVTRSLRTGHVSEDAITHDMISDALSKLMRLAVFDGRGANAVLKITERDFGIFLQNIGLTYKEARRAICLPGRMEPMMPPEEPTEDLLTAKLKEIHAGMLTSCYNSNSELYSLGGARGVKVCNEWDKYEDFITWARSYLQTKGMARVRHLIRCNQSKDFEPDNCHMV